MDTWEAIAEQRDKALEARLAIIAILRSARLSAMERSMLQDAAMELDDAQEKLTAVVNRIVEAIEALEAQENKQQGVMCEVLLS